VRNHLSPCQDSFAALSANSEEQSMDWFNSGNSSIQNPSLSIYRLSEVSFHWSSCQHWLWGGYLTSGISAWFSQSAAVFWSGRHSLPLNAHIIGSFSYAKGSWWG